MRGSSVADANEANVRLMQASRPEDGEATLKVYNDDSRGNRRLRMTRREAQMLKLVGASVSSTGTKEALPWTGLVGQEGTAGASGSK